MSLLSSSARVDHASSRPRRPRSPIAGEPWPRVQAALLTEEHGADVLKLAGDRDVIARAGMIDIAHRCAGRQLLIDLTDVTLLDSAGLVALLWVRELNRRAGGTTSVHAMSAAAQRTIEHAGLTEALISPFPPADGSGVARREAVG